TVLRLQDLKPWFAAVLALPTVDGNSQRVANAKPEDVRDYLLFLILTGARRTEAAKLRWDQVDLIARTFTFHETKNKQRHTLPLSDYLYDMLSTRKEAVAGDYVFPGTGKAGYLVETRRQTAKVVEESGVSFT
ncbi:tyrosine-type recombinase/integrase, partial [Escherichia coli]